MGPLGEDADWDWNWGAGSGAGEAYRIFHLLCTPLCAQCWLAGTGSMLSVPAASSWIGEWEFSVKDEWREEGKAEY